MARKFSMDRRAYLKTVGAAGTTAAVAGCLGDGGNGNGNGESETIIPGTAPGFPPFEYKENGELVGFDIDLAEAVISQAGYEVGGWEEQEFDQLIPALTNGDIDFIAAAMTITDKRDETIDFSDSYYEANQAVLVREDGDFQPEGEEDLSGMRVGAQSGTTGEAEVERLIEEGVVNEADFRQYDNYTLAVQDLENENVDAVVIDIPVANNFAKSRDVTVAFTIETGEQYGFGMRDGDERISDINEGLTTVQENGTYTELVSEYFE